MSSDWHYALYFCYIFIFMIIAKLLKEKTGLFKSIIIPTSLMAGFVGLVLGPEVLGVFDFDINFYKSLVGHFMGVGFIALTLSGSKQTQGKDSVNSGIFIVTNYVMQGIVGMIIVYGLIATIKPDLFPGLGLILPLAYGQGPGFASNIGGSWDLVLPFGYVQQYGLTLATAGFLVGGVIGIFLLNYFVRKHNISITRLNALKGIRTKQVTLRNVKEINFFDTLTSQIAWVSLLYALTYMVMKYLVLGLGYLGPVGETIASLVKGFNFLFGILIALVFKQILKYLNTRGHRAQELIDDYVMQNLTSFAFNVMITSAVLAISLNVIKDYWQLLLAMSIGGALTTWLFISWFGPKVFKVNTRHYMIAMFGMMTGTASTGLALLRGIDPDLETDVAKNLALGTAIATPLGLPLMALLAVPLTGYTTGQPHFNLITLGALVVYLLILIAFALYRNRDKSSS